MPLYNSLNQFKAGFKGGTRANRFRVIPTFPSTLGIGVNNVNISQFTIVSGSLPKADIGVIGVPFRGRMAYFAGDRQYSVWPIRVYDDNGNALWRTFQRWKEKLDGHLTHQVANNDYAYSTLQTNFYIEQLGPNGNVIRKIQLNRCWPSEVGGINFDLGSSEFVTFDVTLTFDNMEIITGI
jgi:hypothetical protein